MSNKATPAILLSFLYLRFSIPLRLLLNSSIPAHHLLSRHRLVVAGPGSGPCFALCKEMIAGLLLSSPAPPVKR